MFQRNPQAAKPSLRGKKVDDPDRQCPIHTKPHPLKKCRSFRSKPIEERKSYLKENRICYRRCGLTQHMAKNCEATIKCFECNSEKHTAALHPGPPPSTTESANIEKEDSREQSESSSSVTSKCMETKFFNLFEVDIKQETSGRRASNFMIESMGGKLQFSLPTLIECDMMPDDRTEIPSPEIARHHPHLQPVANKIPAVDPDAPILLLLGRDQWQLVGCKTEEAGRGLTRGVRGHGPRKKIFVCDFGGDDTT
ncbi:hypothetical protein SKAU_G00193230 [Synaphobranchus kaupii]|uniref:Uncharacterized protein n=1 Tax=Synaphobranchus kaupii TaxID=118154 RepID=A0A9Q1IWJ9_SYNKA|nr:hypothetical protein SKAU_G00193230 [Synaphobranchus kaupii]